MNIYDHTTLPFPTDFTEALWMSISHWHENWADPENMQIFGEDCALCQLVDSINSGSESELSCDGCPVAEYTEKPDCRGTPWIHLRYSPTKQNALAEYQFLVDLLP